MQVISEKYRGSDLANRNAEIFFSAKLAKWYANEPISPCERVLLSRYNHFISGKRVLDLGVGSGRTTAVLFPIAGQYCGCDLSPNMLELARRRFPQARFLERDIRALGLEHEGPYDFVLAAYSLFGALTHEERLGVLSDILKLLAPGALLVFSAHNREWNESGQGPRFGGQIPLSGVPRRTIGFLRDLMIYKANKRFEIHNEVYAMLRDVSHQWRGVFYYIDQTAQRKQLQDLGYELMEVVDEDGMTIQEGQSTQHTGTLNYVCRKRIG